MLIQMGRVGDWLRHRARLRDGNEAHAWGRRGEDLAHRYLQACGYRVVGRNWRTRSGGGEIDVIAMDGDTLVFVEVKTRATDVFGAPEQAVDEAKRRNLLRAASEYLTVSGNDPARARFDIVSVLFGDGESVVHYRDAFSSKAYQYLPAKREPVTTPVKSI